MMVACVAVLAASVDPVAAARKKGGAGPGEAATADAATTNKLTADPATTAMTTATPMTTEPAAGRSVESYGLYLALVFYLFIMVLLVFFVFARWRRFRSHNRNATFYDAVVSFFMSGTRTGAASAGLFHSGPSVVVSAEAGGDKDSKRAPKRANKQQQRQQQQPAPAADAAGFMDGLGRRFFGLMHGNTAVAFGSESTAAARKEKREDNGEEVAVVLSTSMMGPGTVEKREQAGNETV